MTNILYMAQSSDGYIAGPNDETPWSDEEWELFKDFCKTCDAVLLGRRTYEIMRDDSDFVPGVRYIIITRHPSLDTGKFEKRAINAAADMPKGNRIGIIGGGDLNGRLAELKLIDEIILDVEPVELKQGMKLFGSHTVKPHLELLETKQVGSVTQKHYKVTSWH